MWLEAWNKGAGIWGGSLRARGGGGLGLGGAGGLGSGGAGPSGDRTDVWTFGCSLARTDGNSPVFYRTSSPSGLLPKND